MSLMRFFVDAPLTSGERDLPEEEARHLVSVMRGRIGDAITVIDGEGGEARAVVTTIGRGGAAVRVEDVRTIPRPAPLELWCGLPRAGAADDVVRRSVEVGATAVRPLITERGVWRADDDREERRLERFRRAAAAALKQCGSTWMPAFPPPIAVADASFPSGIVAVFGDPATPEGSAGDAAAQAHASASVVVLVGPEGGFSDAEVRTLRERGARGVSAGPYVLRVETAAIALLSAFSSRRR